MQRGIPGRIGQATERGVSAGQGSHLIGAPTAMQDKLTGLLNAWELYLSVQELWYSDWGVFAFLRLTEEAVESYDHQMEQTPMREMSKRREIIKGPTSPQFA